MSEIGAIECDAFFPFVRKYIFLPLAFANFVIAFSVRLVVSYKIQFDPSSSRARGQWLIRLRLVGH